MFNFFRRPKRHEITTSAEFDEAGDEQVTLNIGSSLISAIGSFSVTSRVDHKRVTVLRRGRFGKIMIDGRNEILFADGLFSQDAPEREVTYRGLKITIDSIAKSITIK